MDAKTVLGNNDIDDVRWLCSLTDSELDLLMGLKNMVNMRAKKIGHEALAKKFDLRMLRALSLLFMEHLKGQLKDVPAASGFDCNLLKQNVGGSFDSMTIEDLYHYVCSDQRKRIADMMSEILESVSSYSFFFGFKFYAVGFSEICLLPRSRKPATEDSIRLVSISSHSTNGELSALCLCIAVSFSTLYM
ncbi:hypothetical protein DH2020_020893 [Rehmannia glutinosa]|uniref:Spc97/Spc98 protein n=1 Tax=Rehmannia glutinosa TaxID=99300 RepID=A0ABR0W9F5_REHGL